MNVGQFYLTPRGKDEISEQIAAKRAQLAQLRAQRPEPIDRRICERRSMTEFLEYVDRRQQDRRFSARPASIWGDFK